MGADEDVRAVIRLEQRLLDPDVRRRPELVRPLLHEEFVEFGSSGVVFDAGSVVEALAAATGPTQAQMTATDFEAVVLAADVVMLTFRTADRDRECLRSSVWVRSVTGDWRIRFHQATALPAQGVGP